MAAAALPDWVNTGLMTTPHHHAGLPAVGHCAGAGRLVPNRDPRPRFGGWPVFQHVMPVGASRAIDALEGGGEPSLRTDARDRAPWRERNG